jgi:hypothetical protein
VVGPACQRPTMAHGCVSQLAHIHTCSDTAMAWSQAATSRDAATVTTCRPRLPCRLVSCSTPSKKPDIIFFLAMPSLARSAHARSAAVFCATVPESCCLEPLLPPRAPSCQRRLGVTSSQANHRSEPTGHQGQSAFSTARASPWSAVSGHPLGQPSLP